MVPIPELVVTGFHRSGTSMAMQSLVRAGLYVGDSLIGATATNQDGHYEDIETVKLHDTWLTENQSDWCHRNGLPEVEPERIANSIRSIALRLSRKNKAWGIKDPRAALFLNAWFTTLDNPFGVFVYRHFASCLASLQRRQAYQLFKHPSTEHHAIRLWLDPNIALESWILHNNAMLDIMTTYPDRCLLVSQEAQLEGTSLVHAITNNLPIDLLSTAEAGIDESKTSLIKNIAISTKNKAALLDTWHALQQASEAPANLVPNVQWVEADNQSVVTPIFNKTNCLIEQELLELWDKLDVPALNSHAS